MAFLKEFFEKVDFEKYQQTTKKDAKLPIMQRVKFTFNRTREWFLSRMKALMSLQLTALTERFPASWVVAHIRTFTCNVKQNIYCKLVFN